MISLTQVIGIIIAILLTGMFLVIGYQIVLILQEFKKLLEKSNLVMDDAARVSESIANPVVSLSGFISGIKDGSKLISLFTGKKRGHSDD
jgi:hypothetical protein